MNLAASIAPETSAWVVESLAHVLWQDTLLAGIAAAAGLALRNRSAHARYWTYCATILLTAACLPLNLWLRRSRVLRVLGMPVSGPSVGLTRVAVGSLLVVALASAVLLAVPPANSENDDELPNAQLLESPDDAGQAPLHEAAPTKDGATATGAEALGEMHIRVLDGQGQPLAGAKLFASRSRPPGVEGEQFVRGRYEADESGTILLPIDRKTDTVKLWVGKPGYVPQFVSLRPAVGEESESLPASFEFRLADGATIGGFVVDDEGAPVVDARVDVEVKSNRFDPDTLESIRAKPGIDLRLSVGNSRSPVVTDSEGAWGLTNAPAQPESGEDYSFSVKLSHPDYISGESFGDIVSQQGITTGALREKSAKLVMQRGSALSGLVTDAQGSPVTKGWVVWSDQPYFYGGDWETELDSDGRFQTPPLAPGEHPITVVAPGYAAVRRVVEVNGKLSDLRQSRG